VQWLNAAKCTELVRRASISVFNTVESFNIDRDLYGDGCRWAEEVRGGKSESLHKL